MVARIIMALKAKFFIFISFDAVYVYAAELFPTVIRYGMIDPWFPGRGRDLPQEETGDVRYLA